MWFEYFYFNIIIIFIGLTHIVEMLSTVLYWYIVLSLLYIGAMSSTTDIKRFLFFSESIWIIVFIILLGINILYGNSIINLTAFLILIFTACEAVVLASILLLSAEINSTDKFTNSLNL